MSSTEYQFSVVLIKDGEPEPLLAGQTTGIITEDPSIRFAFLPGKCQTCGLVSLLRGRFQTVSSFERSMGPEIIHVTTHRLQCPHCSNMMNADVQYSEYPRGALQPYELINRENVSYAPIPGLFDFISLLDTPWSGDDTSYDAEGVLQDAVASLDDDIDLESLMSRFSTSEDTTVIVLGSYDDGDESELKEVQDQLEARGYDAYLVKDLPGFSEKSLPDKSSILMLLADFSILIDRTASGAIDEFRLADINHCILARLFPESGSSTFQIGGRAAVDMNYIENFEFSESPLEILEEAAEWAEDFMDERESAYEDYYPWY